MSLFDTAERFASIDRSQTVLNSKRCLHALDSTATCTACFGCCPVNAIKPGKPPELDSEICQSCLACLPVCPVGAYSADDDVSALLSCVARVESKSIELVCGLHPHPETGSDSEGIGIQIHACLAGLGTGAYLLLFALGLERIVLRTDACRDCKWAGLLGQVEHQAESAAYFLAGWNKAANFVCLDQVDTPVERPVWDVTNPPLSRRDLFRLLARQGQVAMARAMENGVFSSKRQAGRDRLRISSAVAHLPEPSSGVSIGLDGFGFAALSISKDCTACGACAKVCPTSALHFEKSKDDKAFSLSFSPPACIGCNLCVQVCAPAAITIDRGPSFENIFGSKEPLILEAGELAHCERCQSLMAARPGQRFCPLCEYRHSHPFGSVLPEALQAQIKKNSQEQHS